MEDRYVVKLVRDRIGERVGPARGFSYEPVADRAAHVRLLRQKLLEEVGEYLTDPSVTELADVLQVVNDLALVDLGCSPSEVFNEANRKAEARGRFAEGLVMVADVPPL